MLGGGANDFLLFTDDGERAVGVARPATAVSHLPRPRTSFVESILCLLAPRVNSDSTPGHCSKSPQAEKPVRVPQIEEGYFWQRPREGRSLSAGSGGAHGHGPRRTESRASSNPTCSTRR